MSKQCACGERDECDHSCMPDVIDGVCSHCGQRVPGLPILPAGMTNETFYKEQAEYWRQIATQNHIPALAQGPFESREDLAKAIAYELETGAFHGARVTGPHLDNYHIYGHVNLLALARAILRRAQPPAAPVETGAKMDGIVTKSVLAAEVRQEELATRNTAALLAQRVEGPRLSAGTEDVRWAVNYLLEQIAAKFEAWDTFDLFRSEAAATVRSFKHDLSSVPPQSVVGWEFVSKDGEHGILTKNHDHAREWVRRGHEARPVVYSSPLSRPESK